MKKCKLSWYSKVIINIKLNTLAIFKMRIKEMLKIFSTNAHISTFVLVNEQLEYKVKDLTTLNQNALNYM